MIVLRAILTCLVFLAAMSPAAHATYESGLKAFEHGDYAQALKDWLVEAENGDARAQHNVGVMYDSGRGVTANPVEARKWYERAAAQGLAEAQNNLGMLYSKGRGVEVSQSRAIELWSAAARRGYPLAQFNLGLAYANGQGVPQNFDKARDLFQSAAAKDLPDAQFALGQVYFLGFGVDPDQREARRWFELASKQNYPGAQDMLLKLDQEEAVTADGNTTTAHGTQTASVSEPPSLTAVDSRGTTSGSSTPAEKPAATPSKPAQTQTAVVPPSSSAPTAPAPASPSETSPASGAVETAAATPAAEAEQPSSGTQATQAPLKPGELRLWLGSLPSRSKAESQWTQLRDSYTDLLKDMDMQVAEVERDQRKFYRVLVGPVPDRDRGKEICRIMQERDPQAWCKVVGGP